MAKPGQAADRVAAEVSDRLERLATAAADAILGSLHAPQVRVPTRAQSLDYWRSYFFTPEGAVNQPGRDRVVAQVGGAEYAEIARGLARLIRQEHEAHQRTVTLARPPAFRPGGASGGATPTVFGPRTQREEAA